MSQRYSIGRIGYKNVGGYPKSSKSLKSKVANCFKMLILSIRLTMTNLLPWPNIRAISSRRKRDFTAPKDEAEEKGEEVGGDVEDAFQG